MPKISYHIHYLLGGAVCCPYWAEMRTNLSHLSQCETVQCTDPIKVNTSILTITAGFQLLNLLKVILIQHDPVFLCNSVNSQNLLQTLVFGIIHCPCLLTFQTWEAALSHSEEKGLWNRTALLSVQFNSVAQLSPTLCNPMNCSMPGLPVHHKLPEFPQTYVHRVNDAIQPSHPLLSPSPPAPNPSQHQGLFQWVSSSHEVARVLEFQLQHQSFQWTFRTDFL